MELGNTFSYSGGDSDNTNLLDLKFHLEKKWKKPCYVNENNKKAQTLLEEKSDIFNDWSHVWLSYVQSWCKN